MAPLSLEHRRSSRVARRGRDRSSHGAPAPLHAVYTNAACRLEAAVASSCGSQHAANEDAHSAARRQRTALRRRRRRRRRRHGADREPAARRRAAPGARGRSRSTPRASRARCSTPTARSPKRSRASPSGPARRRWRSARRSTPSAARWLVAWVGDCRVYRWSARGAGQIDLLTRDDTFGHLGETPPPGSSPDDPARMVGNGATTGANAAVHAIGRDDLLVMCSDGVHKHLDGADWRSVLAPPASLAQRGQALVALARGTRQRRRRDRAAAASLRHRSAQPALARQRGHPFDTERSAR